MLKAVWEIVVRLTGWEKELQNECFSKGNLEWETCLLEKSRLNIPFRVDFVWSKVVWFAGGKEKI